MSNLAAWVKSHRKALVAYAGLVLTLASLAFPHQHWVPVVVAALAAAGVHAVPNGQPAPKEAPKAQAPVP